MVVILEALVEEVAVVVASPGGVCFDMETTGLIFRISLIVGLDFLAVVVVVILSVVELVVVAVVVTLEVVDLKAAILVVDELIDGKITFLTLIISCVVILDINVAVDVEVVERLAEDGPLVVDLAIVELLGV